ncbi:MAG TPA: MFS transporter [Bryobacteraceae bacterium]|nr:MFS transporter [Bryobacteraceae bacterium]
MTANLAFRPATSHVRWTVCALLFFATTISYVDRQVLSMLAKTLETSIGWNDIEYSNITSAFAAAYAVGLLGAGRLLDKYGTRLGFAVALAAWSVAAMAHAAATTAFTFGVARAFLGLGEAANFPACIKTVAEWFPKKERAQSTGIFNSGSNVGVTAAILAVPFLKDRFGWQSAFVATGAIGFLWVVFWLKMYRKPAGDDRVSEKELALIQSDPPDRVEEMPWARLFPHRETWSFAMGKFMTDGVWWFYLFWLPKYLQETFHLSLEQIMVPTLVVYNGSSVGSIVGGWLSSSLIKRGWSINAGRKTALLACAVAVLPVLYAPYSKSMWLTVWLVTLATAAHQGWSANLFTTASDMFPRAAVGSVVGIGGTAGAIGSVLVQKAAGYIHTWTNSYFIVFMICGTSYLLGLAIMQLLSPRMTPANLD